MTKKEAIRKLQKQKAEYLEEWVDFSGVVEAYDMAIEALSSEVVSEDTQTKTELAHIKTRLENVEKRLQGIILYGGVVR